MTLFACEPCSEFFTVPGDVADLVECCPFCGDGKVGHASFTDYVRG